MKDKRNYSKRLFSLLLAIVLSVSFLTPLASAVNVSTLTLSSNTASTYVNETITLSVTISPYNADYDPGSIKWTWVQAPNDTTAGLSLEPSVDSKSCVITGRAAGVAEVLVTYTNPGGATCTDKCTVTVVTKVLPAMIVLNTTSTSLEIGETITIIATVNPNETTDKGISWSINNNAIVKARGETTTTTGSSVVIEAISAGTTVLTAYSKGSSSVFATCSITVVPKIILPESIILDSAQSVIVGKTLALSATVTPTTVTNKAVLWTTSDDKIASVNYTTGLVTAKKVGHCVITATSAADKTVFATCNLEVTVSAFPVTDISLNQTEITVIIGKTTPLVANLLPVNHSNKLIYWTSSDITKATVAASGNSGASMNITGVAEGIVTITAMSAETTSIKATCLVHIIPVPAVLVTEIALNTSSVILIPGGTITPKATINPATASVKTMTWTSSNPNIAAVDNTGKITAISNGVATITVSANDNSGITATCTVSVISINHTEVSLKQNETVTLTINNLPLGGSVSWASSKITAATVSSTSGSSITATAQGAGEATITATVKQGTATVATLKCIITVTATANPIYYYISGKETVSFNVTDFNTVCTNATGNTLSFVKFSLPDSGQGTLYTLYDKTGETRVTSSALYYGAGSPKIAEISFVPSSTFIGPAVISYMGTDNKGNSYTGTVVIAVADATGDIKYSTSMNKPVAFIAADFNEFCRDKTGNTLNSVKFTLPAVTEGTLYYNYDTGSDGKITGQKILATTNYYYSNSPGIGDLSFLPADNFYGSVDIKFSGRDNKTNMISGTVRITVGKSLSVGADIEYIIDKNEVLDFDLGDFNDFCKGVTGSYLNYVQFSLPTPLRGNLFYNYASKMNPGTAVTESARYYRLYNPLLKDVSFVPVENFEGSVSFAFTGLSSNGDPIKGTVGVIVGDAYGDVRYSAGINVPINFDNEEFSLFSKAETDALFEYVQFSLPKPTEGVLYHRYGRSGETVVASGTKYMRTSALRLDEITFIPAENFQGVIEFSFTGKSVTGKNISGTVALTYDPSLTGTPIIYYSTQYKAVNFQITDFIAACGKRGGAALSSVQFVLPPKAVGRLYEGYQRPLIYTSLVSADTVYSGTSGHSISSVSFVPYAGTDGAVSIPYEGKDAKGETYTGYVHISVSPATTSYFTDMRSHLWAISSVEFLREAGIVNGITPSTYGPAMSITRGDFMLMLYRAFNLSSVGTDNFRDVPSGSYYAAAISAGKYAGIAQGGSDGLYRPNASLSREDAMVLIFRTLDYLDRELAVPPLTYLNGFKDASSVSSYAKSAVAALIDAGIILGNDNSELKPRSPVTRAEMAAILHRALTM